MRHIHLIIEAHCLFNISENDNDGPIPIFCMYGVKKPGYHCMENRCRYIAHADAPHEIAFSFEKGEVPYDAWVGFGGDMEPECFSQEEVLSYKKLWADICRRKVNEAYEEYMKLLIKDIT